MYGPIERLRRAWVWWALGSEVVLSAVLCSISIGTKGLWFDEGAAVGFARDSVAQLWRAEWAHEENMILYYLVLHLWIHLGDSEVALRSLSAIFAVGTVVATFLLARRIFGNATAVGAGLLMATAPFAIEYGQTVRSYTMVMFLSVLSTHLLLRALDRPSTARLMLYVVAIVAAVYCHDFGFFVLVAQGCWVLLKRPSPPVTRLVVTGLVIVVLLVPEAALVAHVRGSGDRWISPLSVSQIKTTAYSVGGGEVLATALAGVIVAGLAVFLYRRWHGGLGSFVDWVRSGESSLIAFWLVVPVALTIAISIFRPLLTDRYMLICLPAMSIVAARAVAIAFVAPARIVVLIGLAALGISGADFWYARPSLQDYRAVAAVIAKGHPRTVIEYPYTLDALNYYLQRDGFPPGSFRLVIARSSEELEAAGSAAGPKSWFANQVLVGSTSHSERVLLNELHVHMSNAPTFFRGHGGPALAVTPLR